MTSAIHNRMPVILDRDSYDLWLDPGMTNMQVVSELLKPCDAKAMRCYPVSSRVNNVGNDDAECSQPVVVADSQNQSNLVFLEHELDFRVTQERSVIWKYETS